MRLATDDLVRRAIIQSLMCRFAVSKNAIEAAYRIDFDRYFAAELEALREFEDAGFVSRDGDRLTVLAKGRFLVRSICRVFDRYFAAHGPRVRYSRVI
jgi:oxygen-independent coproporphyrinogen-3 oxidase